MIAAIPRTHVIDTLFAIDSFAHVATGDHVGRDEQGFRENPKGQQKTVTARHPQPPR
jgi:hypothetical protein